MYQGKFDAKKKKTGVDIHDVVTQRNSAPAKKAPPVRQEPPVNAQPAVKKDAPARKQPAPQPAPRKKGPRLGGVIFYTLYFMFILVFFVGTFIGMKYLRDWLIDLEAAQPTLKCEEVFTQLFSDPDWDKLYDAASIENTTYEGKEQFVAYMENKVGDSQLTYLETSAGLSGDKKYNVRLGDEKIASFTLVDNNKAEAITDIPDWQLGTIELFFEREESYLIQKMDGHTVHVNGVALTDDHTIQIASTKADEYLPMGTTGVWMCTQEITGLLAKPEVLIFDESGTQMEVSYDEATRTFTEQTEANTISEEHKQLAIEAVETYSLWMIEEITNRAKIAKYFDPSSDTYTSIIKAEVQFMQDHNGYKFVNQTVSDYYRYTEDLFSVRVSMSLNITRTDGTVKETPVEQTLFFEKQNDGDWLCFEMTAVDVSEPVGKVRLTFMNDGEVLFTDFYDTDASELTTPTISAPEGKVFSGWVREDEDENGTKTLTVVFTPDESGHVSLPVNAVLEPMTLYALFEDAPAATTPETTEGA